MIITAILLISVIFVFKGLANPRLAAKPKIASAVESEFDLSPTKPSSTWTQDDCPSLFPVDSNQPRIANPILEWSDWENFLWKTDSVGAGDSTPIVVGNRVFYTAYSGYGDEKADSNAQPKDLRRALVCLDRETGNELWTRTFDASEYEDSYESFQLYHGYASNTPASDGERIYCFLSKLGVFAFDLEGNELWQFDVGHQRGEYLTGSGSSLCVYHGLLLVNASYESDSIIAIEAKTGKQVWRAQGDDFDGSFTTPIVLEHDGESFVCITLPGSIVGLGLNDGSLKWHIKTHRDGSTTPTMVKSSSNLIFATGGYHQTGTVAFRLGGEGDLSETNVLWNAKFNSRVSTPVCCNGSLFILNQKGVLHCIDCESGKLQGRRRLTGTFYASLVCIGNHIFAQSQNDGTFVVQADKEMRILQRNEITEDISAFNATPVIAGNRIILRSDQAIYCFGDD